MTSPVGLVLFPNIELNVYRNLQLLDPRRISVSSIVDSRQAIGHKSAACEATSESNEALFKLY